MRLVNNICAIVLAAVVALATIPVPPVAAKPAMADAMPCQSSAPEHQGVDTGHSAEHQNSQKQDSCRDCAPGVGTSGCDQHCIGAATLAGAIANAPAVFDPVDLPGHASGVQGTAIKPGLHPPAA